MTLILYVFTAEDFTNVFKGKGTVGPLSVLRFHTTSIFRNVSGIKLFAFGARWDLLRSFI